VKLPADRAGLLESERTRVVGVIDDSNAQTVDVLPTVAGVLGVDVSWRMDGRSLVGGQAPRPEKKVFFNEATKTATFAPGELQASRDQAAKRQADIFGLDRWPAFTVPGYRTLVGRDVGSFGAVRPIDGVRVVFDEREALAAVDLLAPDVPAQLLGRFVEPDDRAAAGRYLLAIGLNGTIVATTRAWPDSLRWMAMLPPGQLRSGRNDIDVFVVDPAQPDSLLGRVGR
jgi:hypothetical protein